MRRSKPTTPTGRWTFARAAIAASLTAWVGAVALHGDTTPRAGDGPRDESSGHDEPRLGMEAKRMRGEGLFEVELQPLEPYNSAADAGLARMSIDKKFTGHLAGTSRGEMLSSGSPASGSAGYVAIERVTGTLAGRSGSFTLQHSATMTPAAQELSITVTPGSGTGELEGLTGSMRIDIVDGEHQYVFEYELPEPR